MSTRILDSLENIVLTEGRSFGDPELQFFTEMGYRMMKNSIGLHCSQGSVKKCHLFFSACQPGLHDSQNLTNLRKAFMLYAMTQNKESGKLCLLVQEKKAWELLWPDELQGLALGLKLELLLPLTKEV